MLNMQRKSQLEGKELAIFTSEFESKKKDSLIMYLLWLFTGGLGGHRYYLGDIGMGIAMTLTLGGFGIWSLIDVFFIGSRLRKKNEELETDILNQIQLMKK